MPRCFLGRPLTRSPRVSRADHSRSFASASFSKNGRRRRPMLSPRAGRGKKATAPREYFPGTALHKRGRDSTSSLLKSQVLKKRTSFSSYAIALPFAGRGDAYAGTPDYTAG